MGTKAQEVRDEARKWIAEGLPVFMLHGVDLNGVCTCQRGREPRPCKSQGKHPAWVKGIRGYSVKHATLDADAVSSWSSSGRNLALALPGFVVIDLDNTVPRLEAALRRLENQLGWLPRTRWQKTPSGGAHYLFRLPEGVTLPVTNARTFGENIDVKTGPDSYIAVSPSIGLTKGKNGPEVTRPYEWYDRDTEIATLPQRWVEHLQAPPNVRVTKSAPSPAAADVCGVKPAPFFTEPQADTLAKLGPAKTTGARWLKGILAADVYPGMTGSRGQQLQRIAWKAAKRITEQSDLTEDEARRLLYHSARLVEFPDDEAEWRIETGLRTGSLSAKEVA